MEVQVLSVHEGIIVCADNEFLHQRYAQSFLVGTRKKITRAHIHKAYDEHTWAKPKQTHI